MAAAEPSAPCTHCGLPVPVSRRETNPRLPQFCCFGCHFAFGVRQAGEAQGNQTPTDLSSDQTPMLRLGIGIFLTMNIMVFSYFFYSRDIFGEQATAGEGYRQIAELLSYFLMFCCTGVFVALGLPLLADTVRILRHKPWNINANTLILIGVIAAMGLSIVNTIRGHYQLYFDTAAIILVLVTLGQYLDGRAKSRATHQTRMAIGSLPQQAWVKRDGQILEIPADELQINDVLRIRPGESIAADGIVVGGTSQVAEAALTGESKPRPVGENDSVLAGSDNIDGLLWVKAIRVGRDRTAMMLEELLRSARLHQPPIQAFADAVSRLFVPLVLVLAVGVFTWHTYDGNFQRGLFDALSVLLISCPCALGLTTPLATWCALASAAEHGIIFDSGLTLERAARIRKIYWDKTGTLTTSGMSLLKIQTTADCSEDQAIAIAGALESASHHPIARAFADEVSRRQLTIQSPQTCSLVPGVGIKATLEGEHWQLGNATGLTPESLAASLPLFSPPSDQRRSLRSAEGSDSATLMASQGLAVYLTRDDQIFARFELGETLRPDAKAALDQLRQMKIKMHMITGDSQANAQPIATQLDLSMEGGLLPDQKLTLLQQAHHETEKGTVGMVGDGINDAPTLGAADVGIAMAGGTDLAHAAGNIRLLTDRLTHVPAALAIGRQAMTQIRRSLCWAFGYNLVGLTLATMGMLNPVFAAAAMAGSSLFVIKTAQQAGQIDTLFAVEKRV